MSLLCAALFCAVATTTFAKPAPCPFKGNYSFFFWSPDTNTAGVGFFTVQMNPALGCRSGSVLPGGILDCNFEEGGAYEEFIDSGTVGIQSDGEGRMSITGSSNDGICDTGYDTLVLDISVVLGGKTVLFSSNGEPDQAGSDITLTGRADKCFAGQINGCYDFHFWTPDEANVGDCTVCVNGANRVTGGQCQCNSFSSEYLSNIVSGGYRLGGNCESSTGYLWITTNSQEICGTESSVAIDFAVAAGGNEIVGACDPAEYIVNTSLANAGYDTACTFEGWKQ